LVIGGDVADHFIVSARWPGCDQGYALLWVDARRPGIRLTAMPLVNGRPCTELHFDHVPVSQADLMGEPDAGFRALQKALRYASLGLCSEVSGATAQALQDTVRFVRERKQFGAPLADLQAVRTKLADMAIGCEMVWAAVCALIAALQSPRHDLDMITVMTKFAIDEIGRDVCNCAIQLHGGMGLTCEAGIGRFLQHTAVARSLYGSSASLLSEYVGYLEKRLYD
jgi:alkylation response protein AidB-like acyl-CoA dehydrogenase